MHLFFPHNFSQFAMIWNEDLVLWQTFYELYMNKKLLKTNRIGFRTFTTIVRDKWILPYEIRKHVFWYKQSYIMTRKLRNNNKIYIICNYQMLNYDKTKPFSHNSNYTWWPKCQLILDYNIISQFTCPQVCCFITGFYNRLFCSLFSTISLKIDHCENFNIPIIDPQNKRYNW